MWGKFVGRAINRGHVGDLRKSFLEGIENHRDPIACVLDEELIDLDSVWPEGTPLDKIGVLRFTLAVYNAVIEMLGGGHRYEALLEIKAELEKELRTELDRNNPDALNKNPATKAYQTQVEREKRIAELRERIRTLGYWLVKIYRRSRWCVLFCG